eukprot:1941224-Rhodomonas_salina.1
MIHMDLPDGIPVQYCAEVSSLGQGWVTVKLLLGRYPYVYPVTMGQCYYGPYYAVVQPYYQYWSGMVGIYPYPGESFVQCAKDLKRCDTPQLPPPTSRMQAEVVVWSGSSTRMGTYLVVTGVLQVPSRVFFCSGSLCLSGGSSAERGAAHVPDTPETFEKFHRNLYPGTRVPRLSHVRPSSTSTKTSKRSITVTARVPGYPSTRVPGSLVGSLIGGH